MNDLCNRVHSDCCVLNVDNSNVLLASDRTCGLPDNVCVGDLYDYVDCDNEFVQTRQRKGKAAQVRVRCNNDKGSTCMCMVGMSQYRKNVLRYIAIYFHCIAI